MGLANSQAGPTTPGTGDPRSMLGGFIRAQRQMANLSLRQLSALSEVSNPYLSQVERGLHEPSVRVLRSIAEALNVSAETLFEHAGLTTDTTRVDDEATEAAIRADRRLTEFQRRALLTVYRSYVGERAPMKSPESHPPAAPLQGNTPFAEETE
jgi:transcriptional regulator with XRE-family HTH domain